MHRGTFRDAERRPPHQYYWSSSECPDDAFGFIRAWYQYFDNDPGPDADLQNQHVKTKTFSVRAVRSF